MKTMKKLASLVLALVMALALAAPAFADETTSITINNPDAGHTYEAYQIFVGTLDTVDGNKVLSNITWGSGITDAGKTALLTWYTTKAGDEAKENPTPADLADYLGANNNNATLAKDFAAEVGKVLGTATASASTPTDGAGKDGKAGYVITVPAAGYYLVKDQNSSLEDKDDSYTSYILQVVGQEKVDPKADTPTSDKHIVSDANGNDPVKGASYDVGDTVYFELTATLPSNYDVYTAYELKFVDKMSTGLSYNKIEKATAGNQDITNEATTAANCTGQDLTIHFTNLKNDVAGLNNGTTIKIVYSATLNQNAVDGNYENTNDMHIEFSNNPNGTGTGKTPDSKVYVYDFDINVNKKIGDTENPLPGAKFVLYKEENNVKTYYKLANGDVEWVAEDVVFDNSGKFIAAEGAVTVETSGDDGKVSFKGLQAGTYHLVEVEAPAGYNKLEAPVDVTITAVYGANGQIVLTAEEGEPVSNVTATGTTAQVSTDVKNYAGATLPSTGGIGTTIFYVVGGVLAAGAVILLITKRRMNIEK